MRAPRALLAAIALSAVAVTAGGCHHYRAHDPYNPYNPGHRAVVHGLIGAGLGVGIAAIGRGNLGTGAAIGGVIGAITGLVTTPPPAYDRRGYYEDDHEYRRRRHDRRRHDRDRYWD